MAKSTLPDALERRHLVERELPAEQALRVADAYLEQERVWEAIEFLTKAGAHERLAALRDEAVAAGDAFLVREISRALGEAPGAETWRRLEEAAQRTGKERYTAEARRQFESSEE